MSALVNVGKSLVGGLVGAVIGRKKKTDAASQAQALPTVTRSEAAAQAARRDQEARRLGTGANRRTPMGAGEASTQPRKSLLGRG